MATVEVAREDIVRRQLAAIGRDPNAVAALYAPDAVRYDPITPEGMKGRDAIRKFQEMMAKAIPDISTRAVSITSKDDTVAAEWIVTGTLSGPIELPTGTLAPTNRQFTLRGATFYRFNNEGLIAEHRQYFDMASFAQQLGVKL